MATQPKWLPRRDGKQRRGLEVEPDGRLSWAAVNKGTTRTTSIWINQPGLKFQSSNTAVVEAKYGSNSVSGAYAVSLEGLHQGEATVTAYDTYGRKADL